MRRQPAAGVTSGDEEERQTAPEHEEGRVDWFGVEGNKDTEGRPRVPELWQESEAPAGLVPTQLAGPRPQAFRLGRCGAEP